VYGLRRWRYGVWIEEMRIIVTVESGLPNLCKVEPDDWVYMRGAQNLLDRYWF
jgi:hypothetical protein